MFLCYYKRAHKTYTFKLILQSKQGKITSDVPWDFPIPASGSSKAKYGKDINWGENSYVREKESTGHRKSDVMPSKHQQCSPDHENQIKVILDTSVLD